MIETTKEPIITGIVKNIGIISFAALLNILISILTQYKLNSYLHLAISVSLIFLLYLLFSYKQFSTERKQGLIPVNTTGQPLLSLENYKSEDVYWVEPYEAKFTIQFTGIKRINWHEFAFLVENKSKNNFIILDEDLLNILPKIKNGFYTGSFNVKVYKTYTSLVPIIPERN
jgi:hypothetical protein